MGDDTGLFFVGLGDAFVGHKVMSEPVDNLFGDLGQFGEFAIEGIVDQNGNDLVVSLSTIK
jgi:hypothetical protein